MTSVDSSFPTDAYTSTVYTIDVSTLFTVTPDFCREYITFSCSVTGPNGDETYSGTDYPAQMCTINSQNELDVLATPDNYRSQDADENLTPGSYTFTITAHIEGTADTLDTEITWTVTDPCESATLAMDAYSAPFNYIFGNLASENNSLNTAVPSIIGFCDVSYTLSVDSDINPCLVNLDLTFALNFDLTCTGAADLATVVGTLTERSYTATWTAELSSPYSVGAIDTKAEDFIIVITNPCYDSSKVEITVGAAMPDYRYYTAADNTEAETFDFESFTTSGLTANTQYRETCTLSLSSIIYDPANTAVAVTDATSPVSKPDASVNTLAIFTTDISLIGDFVPYDVTYCFTAAPTICETDTGEIEYSDINCDIDYSAV